MLSSNKIGAKVVKILNDAKFKRWTVGELATWINAGCVEMVDLKPSILPVNVSIPLAAGTRQTFVGVALVNPADGSDLSITPMRLLSIVRLSGNDGKTPGRVIHSVMRETIDVVNPDWHSETGDAVQFYVIDQTNDKQFFVSPGVKTDVTQYVEGTVSRYPVNTLLDDAESLGDDDIDSGFDDVHELALVDYVLYRAFSKDAEASDMAARSQNHYAAFLGKMGVSQRRSAPKKAAAPAEQ